VDAGLLPNSRAHGELLEVIGQRVTELQTEAQIE
jgi:hypothetical protein